MDQSKATIQGLSTAGVEEWTKKLSINTPPAQDFATPGMEIFKLGDWKLQSGETIPDAFIAYKTYGEPGLPAIIYPSWYSGCKSSPQIVSVIDVDCSSDFGQ